MHTYIHTWKIREQSCIGRKPVFKQPLLCFLGCSWRLNLLLLMKKKKSKHMWNHSRLKTKQKLKSLVYHEECLTENLKRPYNLKSEHSWWLTTHTAWLECLRWRPLTVFDIFRKRYLLPQMPVQLHLPGDLGMKNCWRKEKEQFLTFFLFFLSQAMKGYCISNLK